MPDLRDRLFTLRSYTPIPFLLLGLILGAPTIPSITIGIVIAIMGEGIRFWGVGHASYETRVTESVGASRLVISGPFAYVRNPLYIGNILLYSGFAVMANRIWLIVVTALWFMFQYSMIVSREEEFLTQAFADDYAAYRRAVPRFLPRLHPYAGIPNETINWQVAVRSERRTFQAFGIALLLLIARLILMPYAL